MSRDNDSYRIRPTARPRLARILTALLLFGAAFGYVEAAVVVYVRGLYEPLHQRLHPDRPPDDLFPLLSVEQLEAAGPPYLRWLATELVREGATLVMLAAVALAVAQNRREWLAAFMVVFGVWDLFFYGSLKVLLDWPESLWTWDLLFLLPLPWAGPVLAPSLVAVGMIGAGVVVLGRETAGRPLHLGWIRGAVIGTGGLLVVLAFCWDWRNTMAGGEPRPFHWPLFAFGGGLGLAAFLHACWARPALTVMPALCAGVCDEESTAPLAEYPAPPGSRPPACSSG
jgi:hypothetical protein